MIHRFGVFEFDTATSELRRNGRLVAMEPQPARALAVLLSRPGEVVTRDALKEAVWGAATHVDFDRGLAYCLSQVRAALGDSGDNPRFVQTLPKKGYKFIAPVSSSDNDVSGALAPAADNESLATTIRAPRVPVSSRLLTVGVVLLVGAVAALTWAAMRQSPAPRAVVAVSIFDNETGMPEYDRLVAGLSDLVVTRLTQLDPDRVAVVGNAAVLRQPRNIRNLTAVAAGVKADFVLLGQLQMADSGLRFITHVIRLSDATHLKANRIPLPGGDVSGLEMAVVAEFERAIREQVLK